MLMYHPPPGCVAACSTRPVTREPVRIFPPEGNGTFCATVADIACPFVSFLALRAELSVTGNAVPSGISWAHTIAAARKTRAMIFTTRRYACDAAPVNVPAY